MPRFGPTFTAAYQPEAQNPPSTTLSKQEFEVFKDAFWNGILWGGCMMGCFLNLPPALQEWNNMKLREIKHCRLAMVGFFFMVLRNASTGA